ncbi:oxygen-independent coproporphyrinogen III oxidase [Phenylobacterium montanum]|uniref:Coproporphyrinogen-III oxidase n=2 Tax=Phenylobacterium montanum TaxID=2823693 RepID=A0A975G4Z3_9CAUL|nr:oxygen-independent coproporphyrinogen III oxidase [Caulobacter sp. S6]
MLAPPRASEVSAPADVTGLLLSRYGGQVPRYTSYPTAAQFGPEVGADLHGEWLSQVSPHKPVSVYAHIPFCARLCWFCGCNTRVVNSKYSLAGYLAVLRAEAALVEQRLPAGVWANALHLGGGTPNLLSRDDLNALFDIVRHVFKLAPGAEVAAELDPASLTREWVRAAAFHGLSRASLGVQDLSPHVQAAVNRRESFEVVASSVAWLREVQVRSINLDLMYGLPCQTSADVVATLDQVLRLQPERIALFGYAHVPWMKAHQKLIDAKDLPGLSERFDQSAIAAEHLARAGYVAIGLDHFALPHDELAVATREGRLHRNFQGYTTDACKTLIGLGASSISSFAQGYAQNASTELDWRRRVADGVLPTARGRVVTEDDRFRGQIIERLMCDFAVDLEQACADHGRGLDRLAEEIGRLEAIIADGLAEFDGRRLAVTRRGRPFVRSVAAVFDRYLQPSVARHAPAV